MFTFFFFNDTATTEIYTLSLHDALPILMRATAPAPSNVRRFRKRLCARASSAWPIARGSVQAAEPPAPRQLARRDRKSTRLNSSHSQNSYAGFCLKKKKNTYKTLTLRSL